MARDDLFRLRHLTFLGIRQSVLRHLHRVNLSRE